MGGAWWDHLHVVGSGLDRSISILIFFNLLRPNYTIINTQFPPGCKTPGYRTNIGILMLNYESSILCEIIASPHSVEFKWATWRP